MGLMARGVISLTALFGLLFALIAMITFVTVPFTLVGLVIIIAIVMVFVFFQYLISPILITWIYRIDWIPYDDFVQHFPHLAKVVDKVCQIRGTKTPKMGIIHDLNPNAFTYGWTKNSARLVITDGILHYLNEREQAAVVGHEMGHIVHNDFIFMTIVFAIPMILLMVARWAYYFGRFSSGGSSSRDEAVYLQLALFAIGILAYIAYWIGYLISLFLSRIREYYADEHGAQSTEDPNALSTALVKIAYGLLEMGNEVETKKSNVRATRGLGIFDANSAKQFSAASAGSSGKYSKNAIQAAAAWDLFNPWAKYFQLMSTHPLPAKRIEALNDQCENYGKKPEIDLSKAKKIKEEQAGKSMFPEFMLDVTVKILPILVLLGLLLTTIMIILAGAGLLPYVPVVITNAILPNLILYWGIGFLIVGFAVIIKTLFMYRSDFKPQTILDLVTYIKASPVRCVPAVIEGKIVGRGQPGYYFGEDLYFQDQTGLIHVDYKSMIPFFGDLIFALRKVKKYVGQRVRITGYYRRGPGPYFQIKLIESESGLRNKNYRKQASYFWAAVAFIIGYVLLFFWFSTL